MTDLYTNGRLFTSDARRFAEAMVVTGDRLAYVGDAETAARIAGTDASTTDLDGALVLPGFVDGHAHVVSTGEVAGHVSLWGAADLAEIQRRIAAFADAHPDAPRIRAQGWAHFMLPGGVPDRAMLDEVVSDRPVYALAFDFHSAWLNSAALAERGIDAATPSPPGGTVHHGSDGEPTGYIDETAMQRLVEAPLQEGTTDADRDAAVEAAMASYRRLGVTAATDMGLDAHELAALARAEEAGTLTARIAGHWLVHPSDDPEDTLAQVARAAELARAHGSELLRVVGIKVMIDGTVDGCTAALGHPYVDGSLPGPIWSLADLAPVVAAADEAGLQVAMHAIGDEAVRIAIAAVEAAVATNAPRERRHRIEHLEVVEPAEIARLAALGITASMQPVHADPAIQANWRAQLGDERIERGFPWPEMTDAGARLAFGTDSPTSPEAPLPNMFVAATRRSALDASLDANVPAYALPLPAAIAHATTDAAWASGGEHLHGRLAAGLAADFIVLDRDVFDAEADALLEARIVRTVVGGRTVYEA